MLKVIQQFSNSDLKKNKKNKKNKKWELCRYGIEEKVLKDEYEKLIKKIENLIPDAVDINSEKIMALFPLSEEIDKKFVKIDYQFQCEYLGNICKQIGDYLFTKYKYELDISSVRKNGQYYINLTIFLRKKEY